MQSLAYLCRYILSLWQANAEQMTQWSLDLTQQKSGFKEGMCVICAMRMRMHLPHNCLSVATPAEPRGELKTYVCANFGWWKTYTPHFAEEICEYFPHTSMWIWLWIWLRILSWIFHDHLNLPRQATTDLRNSHRNSLGNSHWNSHLQEAKFAQDSLRRMPGLRKTLRRKVPVRIF